jgi:DNA-binding transcriptional LysR family regulator
VDAASALTDGVVALRGGQRARLRVAASLTVAEYLLSQWLLVLRRRRPELEIAVSVANSHEVGERVRDGSVDVGFIESPDGPNGLRSKVIGEDRLVLVVAADDPLAAQVEPIRPAELLDAPLLLREPGSGTRDTFLHSLSAQVGSGPPTRVTELGSTATIIAAARAGGGIGVVSSRAVQAELADGRLAELRSDGLDLRRPLRAIWRGSRLVAAATELVNLATRTQSSTEESRSPRPSVT